MEDLEHTIGKASLLEDPLDLLGTSWCLWGWLKNDRIARKQSRYKRVDEGQIWVLRNRSAFMQVVQSIAAHTFQGNKIRIGPSGTFLT